MICAAGLWALAVVVLPLQPGGTPRAEAAGDVAHSAEALDQAVVNLMILDRKVADADALLRSGEAEMERVLAEAQDAKDTAARAQADLKEARSRFSGRLAESYKAGDIGWLEILLTSDSLSDFLNRSALVSRIIDQDAELTRRVEEARERALSAVTHLAEATERERGRVLESRARRDELQEARSAQAALVESLGDRLQAAREAARAAAERMAAVNSGVGTGTPTTTVGTGAVTTRPTSPTTDVSTTGTTRPAPSPGAGPSPGGRTLTVKAYAYALRGTTAGGIPVAPGVIAVDPRVIPLGTRLWIPGYGQGIAADTGGDIKGNTIDVWVPTEKQARDWGIKTLTITVYD